MTLRVYLTDFALANPLYAGATVEVFEVNQNLANTGVYATVYAGPTGPALRSNPITLDSDGKYPGLHYVEKPVIQRVTRGTEQLELGVHGLVPRWRGVWTGATLYYVGERVRHPTDPVTYVCRSSHISANFAADLAANLWQQEFDANTIADAVSAGLIGGILPNTPQTFLRVAPGGTAIEGRTAAQVRGDLSVLTQAQLESGYARLAFANVFTQPQTLPASNPTDPNHATRKAYVDAGDRWVTLVDAAITNSTIIDVTGFSLADYYLVQAHLLNVLPTSNSSSALGVQVYRNQSLVSTGYFQLRLSVWPTGVNSGSQSNTSNLPITASGIQTERMVSNITISQTESNQMALLQAITFFQENSSNVMYFMHTYGRATGGSGWVDGLRITSPVNLTANVGRLVVMGLKKS
jgi:hypothetical protein